MSCDGWSALDPMCQLQNGVAAVAGSALSGLAGSFGDAAVSATAWLWEQIDSATTVDLGSPTVTGQLASTAAIAGVLCVALFTIQLIMAVLRHEPGALGRALRGLVIAGVGSAFALAATRILITVVDGLANGLVQHTLGTNIAGIGAKLDLANIAGTGSPAVGLLLSLALLGSVFLVWAAMMVRKLMLVVMAVLAPIAFAGAAADLSRSWVRRWVEFVIAMIASKLLLVLIMCLGVGLTGDAGTTPGQGGTHAATQLATGTLLLLLGGLSPWLAIRMTHFAGDSLHTMHSTAALSTAGARTVIAAPQKAAALHAQGQAAMASVGATAVGGAGRRPAPQTSAGPRPTAASGPSVDAAPSPPPTPPTTDIASTSRPIPPGVGIEPSFGAPKSALVTSNPSPAGASSAATTRSPGPAAAPKPAAASNPPPTPRTQPAPSHGPGPNSPPTRRL